MKLREIIDELDVTVLNKLDYDQEMEILNGYICDLLSQVLGKAKKDSIWITVQSHMNIIGVATMVDAKAIIVCEGHEVPNDVVEKADEEGIVIMKSEEGAFVLGGELYKRGVQ